MNGNKSHNNNSYASGRRPLDNFLTLFYQRLWHPAEKNTDTISSLTHSHYVRCLPNKNNLTDRNLTYKTISSTCPSSPKPSEPSPPSVSLLPPTLLLNTNIKNATIQNQKYTLFLYQDPPIRPCAPNLCTCAHGILLVTGGKPRFPGGPPSMVNKGKSKGLSRSHSTQSDQTPRMKTFVATLEAIPADDWCRTWVADRTIMLRRTSRRVKEKVDKMLLSAVVCGSTQRHHLFGCKLRPALLGRPSLGPDIFSIPHRIGDMRYL